MTAPSDDLARLAFLCVGEQLEHRPAVHRHGAAVRYPAYVAGLIWSVGWQVTHVGLYLWPAWLPVAKRLLGH